MKAVNNPRIAIRVPNGGHDLENATGLVIQEKDLMVEVLVTSGKYFGKNVSVLKSHIHPV